MNTEVTLDEIIEQMSDAINGGKPLIAIDIGEVYRREQDQAPDNPDFWKKLVIACYLDNQPDRARYVLTLGRIVSDFTQVDEADVECDIILDDIRHARSLRKSSHMPQLLERIQRVQALFSSLQDDNQLARTIMIEGRIFYAFGEYEKAQTRFNRAAVMWTRLQTSGKDHDEQWERNNRFYEMLSLSHKVIDASLARNRAREVLSDEGEMNGKRVVVAKLIKKRYIPAVLTACAADFLSRQKYSDTK